jgi:energy-coupling factor transport system ATP-binding protein
VTFRPGPLRAAALLAAGFVAVRVVYRVLFHGADGSGAVLLPLPELRLPPPFAHVVVLGPVTVDGLWDAAASAFPIALTILAFGLVNALIDVPRVFARASRRGPLGGIARALAIAWATLPSLADAARRVRFAQRLRGERAGVRMLMPLLQRTLERAGSVAAALELRGFAGRSCEGDCRTPVEVEGAELHFDGGLDAAGPGDLADAGGRGVRIESLVLHPGGLTLLTGPTGSGKSTLLRALAGLHTHVDGGWMSGTMRVAGHDRLAVPPRDLAQRIGVVLQNPRDAFATERVRDEIGLALELRGVAQVIVAARVSEVAGRVGITPLLDRPTRGLSAGEATLVAVAAAIVEQPILLLVDEPLADLDADARARVANLLDSLAQEAGMCVLVAEHRADPLRVFADEELRIDAGAVLPLGLGAEVSAAASDSDPSSSSAGHGSGAARDRPAAFDRATSGPFVLRATNVTVRHRDTVAVDRANLELRSGEIVALVGANGAGKSSLLAALALPGRDDQVECAGRVALVPDASDDLFVYDTVSAECGRADRRARTSRGSAARPTTTAERFAGFLGLDPLGVEFSERLARHPRDLSVGERRCLAVAIQLAGDPTALLVDEPTRGLDPVARELVRAALFTLAERGTAVLVASHEPDVAARADRVLSMRAGVLSSAEPFVTQSSHTARPADEPDSAVAARPRTELRTPNSSAPHDLSDLGIRAEGRARASARQVSRRASLLALLAANLVALGAFCWPLLATAMPAQAHAAAAVVALAVAPLAALVVFAALDGSVRSAHMLALLGTLAAIGAAVRIASTGVGGVEAVFILLILAGRAFGARFGMLLGMATIALSTVVTGTFGPWTPFQMFACAWVGAVAGLLPRRLGGATEIAMLCGYGAVASYVFGLLMNLWFWPFAVGSGTEISYDGAAPLGTNLASFLLYSLVTSTLSWDTLRAITSVIGILIIGRPVVAALRRAKPLQPRRQAVPSPASRRAQERSTPAGASRA